MSLKKIVALDTETELIAGLNDRVRVRTDPPALVCGSWCHADGRGVDEDRQTFCERVFLWAAAGWTLVFHNAAFDIRVLAASHAYKADLEEALRCALEERRILDTRVMHALRHPQDTLRSLENLAATLLDRDLSAGKETVRLSYRLGEPLTTAQREYALQDAVATYDLAVALQAKEYGALGEYPEFFQLKEIHCEEAAAFDPDREYSAAAGWAAFSLDRHGMRVNLDRLGEYRDAARAEVDAQLRKLAAEGLAKWKRRPKAGVEGPLPPPYYCKSKKWIACGEGYMYRQRTPKGEKTIYERVPADLALDNTALRQAYAAAAVELDITPPRSEKTRALSLEYDFWKPLYNDLPAALQLHIDLGKTRKLLSTYYEPLHEAAAGRPELRVYPNYGIGLAETGRWRCWRPNIQNQPKKIRDMYVAPPGHVFVSADYKSLEMFTACEAMARLGIKGRLRDVLDAGGDLHRRTAALMFDKKEESVEPKERQAAKIANFSLLGGMGPRLFRKQARNAGLDWTIGDAKEMRARWFEVFEDCRAFLDRFEVDPWLSLKPPGMSRAEFLRELHIPYQDAWPSKWDLIKGVNDGRIYHCKLPSGRACPNRGFSQAANYFFQGIGADVVTRAFNLCCDAGLRVCAVVHDSITLEECQEWGEEAGGLLAHYMQKAQREICSCGVDIPVPEVTIGSSWT